MNSTRRNLKTLLVSALLLAALAIFFVAAEQRERILLRNTLLLAGAVLSISLPLGTAIGIAAAMGLPLKQEYIAPNGRPFKICDNGQPISKLLA